MYASTYNPDVLLYRKQRGFLDFDERMAVLIQVVQGERYRNFYFPTVAGVAYSRNPYLWSPKLRREDGLPGSSWAWARAPWIIRAKTIRAWSR